MGNSNAKKTRQLGVPHGTARNRLVKQILFNLVCKYGLNICFKCKQPILAVTDFTIEHKQPWLDIDPAPTESGAAWCRKHKQFLPVEQFAKNRSRWNGLQSDCRFAIMDGFARVIFPTEIFGFPQPLLPT